MCDICKKAGDELATFLDQLEEKYPGTEIKGQKIPHSHHVNVAVIDAARQAFIREVRESAEIAGVENPLAAGPFGGGFKVIENQ